MTTHYSIQGLSGASPAPLMLSSLEYLECLEYSGPHVGPPRRNACGVGTRVSIARAAPCILAAWMRRCGINSPSGLAMAACTTTTVAAQFQVPSVRLRSGCAPAVVAATVLMAGTVLGAVHYEEQQFAECVSKKKQKVMAKPAAAKKKAGSALSELESAMEGEKIYEVEKLCHGRQLP